MTNFNPENKLNFTTGDNGEKLTIEQKKIGLGYVGRFFGDNKAAATNITGIVILIIVSPIPILCFYSPNITPLDYIKVTLATIGPIMGYFFGKYS